MKVAMIVQARLGSSRLPGKVLLPLGDRTVLAEVLHRVSLTPGVTDVVCAVPDLSRDDPVAEEARRVGAIVVRGSECDVLARYYQAAQEVQADIIMRVTSDCPLTDPQLNAQVLELLCCSNADYAANNLTRTYPHGLDCEAFTMEVLATAHAYATCRSDREHVTPFIRRSRNFRCRNLTNDAGNQSGHRWTLDYLEDYAFFQALFASSASEAEPSAWRSVLESLADKPWIAALNADMAQSS